MMLGILSILLLLSVTIPITFTTVAHVPYSMDKTMEQLTTADQLSKWFLPFANLNGSRYTKSQQPSAHLKASQHELRVISARPDVAILSFRHEQEQKRYRFQVNPGKKNSRNATVSITLINTAWERFFDQQEVDKEVIQSLRNLQEFTNSTKRFYGFEIRRDKLTDSTLLFITRSVTPEQKSQATRQLFDSLTQYVQKKKIAYNGKRIFFSQLMHPGELQIFAGLSVNSNFVPSPADGISKRTLPAGKDMLVANFKGPYREVENVYKALEQYRRDHALVSAGMPFEDFQTAGYGFGPEDVVELKVCNPIN